MKAVIAHGYGEPEVLSVQEVKQPIPKDNEILIEVYASSLNSGDVRMRSLDGGDGIKGFLAKRFIRLALGLRKPRRVPGSVLAGKVIEVGSSVTRFSPGAEVYAMAGFSFGAFGEYCALPNKRAIALKPKKASFEEASAIPFGGNTALYFLRKAGIAKGKNVLVYGSTGAVGSSAVQIAKSFGATVTAVSGSDGMKLTKSLGADVVFDYKKTELSEIESQFDIVFDAVGKISKSKAAHLLSDGGVYSTVDSLDVAKELSSDLEELAKMYDDGKLVSVIDKVFDIEDIVEANRYVDTGRKKGNVVIRIKSER